MASSEMCSSLKRPSEGNIALCCSVIVKGSDPIVKNMIYSYSRDNTWEDVLAGLTDDLGFTLGKANTLNVSLMTKLSSPEVFHLDFLEPIHLALDFDKSLKYEIYV